MGKFKIFSIWIVISLTIATTSSCNVFFTSQQTLNCTEFNVLSVKEAYAQVDGVAMQWDEDAYLEEVFLYVYPKTNTSALLATFEYRSLSSHSKGANFDYIIRSDVEITQRDFNPGELELLGTSLDFDNLSLDSLDALKIMCEQLGNEFYNNCKVGHWPLPMTLKQGFPGISDEDVWVMSFACDRPENGSVIIIDANSGEVLEIRK